MSWIPPGFEIIAGAAAVVALRLQRRARACGSSRADAYAGAILLFAATCVAVSATLHIVTSLRNRLLEPAPRYDFLIYSLVFVGVFLLGNAIICMRAASAVTGRDEAARSRATAALARILTASVPLLPFAPHGWYVCVFAMSSLAALQFAGASARRFAIRRLTPVHCDTLSVHERSLRSTHAAAVRHAGGANAARLDQR